MSSPNEIPRVSTYTIGFAIILSCLSAVALGNPGEVLEYFNNGQRTCRFNCRQINPLNDCPPSNCPPPGRLPQFIQKLSNIFYFSKHQNEMEIAAHLTVILKLIVLFTIHTKIRISTGHVKWLSTSNKNCYII